jgi:hypothetical protein
MVYGTIPLVVTRESKLIALLSLGSVAAMRPLWELRGLLLKYELRVCVEMFLVRSQLLSPGLGTLLDGFV